MKNLITILFLLLTNVSMSGVSEIIQSKVAESGLTPIYQNSENENITLDEFIGYLNKDVGYSYYSNEKNIVFSLIDVNQQQQMVDQYKEQIRQSNATDLMLKDLSSKKLKLSEISDKYKLIYFWDPRCSGCVEHFEHLNNMKLLSRKFDYLLILTYEDKEAFEVIKKNKLLFDVYSSHPDLISNFLNVKNLSTPLVALTDPNNKIVDVYFAFHEYDLILLFEDFLTKNNMKMN